MVNNIDVEALRGCANISFIVLKALPLPEL